MTFPARGSHPDELISASLTGDLTGSERRALDEHLAGCATCRETLTAFGEQRAMMAGLRHNAPPRDLRARVRTGIEAGGHGRTPWWRQLGPLVGIGAGLASAAAVVLAVVVFSNLPPIGPEVASTSASTAPTGVPDATPADEETPAPRQALAVGPDDVTFLAYGGGDPDRTRQLTVVNQTTAETIEIDTPSGPPISAALSPDGSWLAYITLIGESGHHEVWATNLTEGQTEHLGCSQSVPFTDRLIWSANGGTLAYTLVGDELGPEAPSCERTSQAASQTDAWLFQTTSGERNAVTESGDAFAADFDPVVADNGDETLYVSHAGEVPTTVAVTLSDGAPGEVPTGPEVESVFMPQLSPDGSRALFWRGEMARNESGTWAMVAGGLPYLSGDPIEGEPTWSGQPLFRDVTVSGDQGFITGSYAWSPRGDYVAFWAGVWTGDGDYPNGRDAYIARTEELLSRDARLAIGPGEIRVADVTFSREKLTAIVMLAPPAEVAAGDPPPAELWEWPLEGGEPTRIDEVEGDGLPWNGPAVIGEEGEPTP